ncbi:MAG: hypothetical protein P0S95_06395 [Rhabdochlamydiaceae bacterium]|nr:hypothetical protein [Candidatus Amphrikana amoebophyrae]
MSLGSTESTLNSSRPDWQDDQYTLLKQITDSAITSLCSGNAISPLDYATPHLKRVLAVLNTIPRIKKLDTSEDPSISQLCKAAREAAKSEVSVIKKRLDSLSQRKMDDEADQLKRILVLLEKISK